MKFTVAIFGKIVNIDDVNDEAIEEEMGQELEVHLESQRGKHQKTRTQQFQFEARDLVRNRGYVKGAPNLNLGKFVEWVQEKSKPTRNPLVSQ